MALSAVTFKPSDKPDAELSTIKEEQPLLEEQYLEKASVHLDNRLFIATTGCVSCYDTTPQPPVRVWYAKVNVFVNSNITMRLFGGVLVLASGGQVVEVDAEKGTVLRTFELTTSLEAQLTTMVVHKRMIIANSTHRLVAISRDRFKKIWKSGDLGERFECLLMCGENLFVAVDGEVHAVDLETGQSIYTETFEGPRRAITVYADESNPERPMLYVGHCGKVHVIDVKEKKRLEKVMLVSEDDTFGVALTMWRGVLLATSGGVVMAFSTETHEPAWLLQYGHETGYGFMASLSCFIHGGTDIVIIGSNGYVVAADVKTGKQLWLTSLPKGGYAFVSSLFYDGVLYATSNGRMWAINLDTGEVSWNIGLEGLGSHSPLLLSTTARNSIQSDTPIIQAQKRTPSFSLLR